MNNNSTITSFPQTTDTIVNNVVAKFIQRSNLGIQKYNTTLDRNDLSILDWINHVQEELQDAILYLERLKREFSPDAQKHED